MIAVLTYIKRTLQTLFRPFNRTHFENPQTSKQPVETPLQTQPSPVPHEVKELLTRSPLPAPPATVHNGHPNGTKPQTGKPDEDRAPTVLGVDVHSGKEVTISQEARQQGMNCPGVNGAGKSTLFLNMILSDIRAGRGVAGIDPHGDLVRSILAGMPAERLKDVLLLDVTDADFPIGLNLFETPLPSTIRSKAATASFLAHVFSKVWGAGTETPRLMMVLRAVTRTLIDNPGTTFCEIPLLLSSDTIRQQMVSHLTNQEIISFWENYNRRSQRDKDDLTASTMNKVAAFLDEPMIRHIVGQSKSTLSFRRIMDEGKILLVSLSPQFEEASSLLGAVIIGRLLMAAFSRVDTPEAIRRPFYLYADEWHRYATSDFATLLAEARKFHLSTILANQTLEQLNDANRAAALQAGSLVCFRVSGEDSKVYAKSYDATPTMEQVGVEPQRAPVADILTHLVRRGHDDPRVAKFGQTYLANLERFLNKPPGQHEPRYSAYYKCFDGQIGLPEKHVVLARDWLNDTLYQAMLEKRSDLHIQTLSLYILAVAQGDGREYIMSNLVIKSLGEFKAFKPGVEKFGKPSFTTPATSQDYISQVAKKWKKKYVWMAEEWVSMIKELRYVMSVLAKTSILIDTGHYVPKYRQRSYQDQENLIANELSTLPNYTTKVRLLTGEHTIRTLPAPPLLSEIELQERITAIKQRMLFFGVTKPYTEVEQEIQRRQAALWEQAAADDAPPPTSVTGNQRRRRKPTPANT